MKTESIQIQKTIYRSEKFPEVYGESLRNKEVIEFLDEHPVVYDIVTKTKSKAFGRKSSVYLSWAQNNNSPEAILHKISVFKSRLKEPTLFFFAWSANFTFDHYRDKHFKGGFFQQWDKKYPRNCLTLDFTPETLNEVIEKFRDWCGNMYQTKKITVDKLEVWTT